MERTLVFFCLLEAVHQGTATPEPGLLQSLFLAAESRPWLWSVYVVSVGLPLVIFISLMWPDKRFGPPDQPYYYKKSDEPQEDEPQEDEPREDDPERSPLFEPSAAPDGRADPGARRRDVAQTQKKKKSDLDLKAE